MLKNIIANYVGKVWSIASIYIFIPIYIKLLGMEAYGIINFYTLLLAMLFFADAGLSATLNRELARSQSKEYVQRIVHTIERIYLYLCTFIGAFIIIAAPFIAKKFIHSDTLDSSHIINSIRLMGGAMALHFFSTLYISGLMGLQMQVKANAYQIIWGVFRAAIVIVPLFFFRTIEVYFAWQLIVNIVYLFFLRRFLWRKIKTDYKPYFDKPALRNIAGFALGMMGMTIISGLNTQIDKLIVSNKLTLTDFSYYSLASIISQIPMIVITPIALAVLPKLTKDSTNPDKSALIKTYHIYSFVIACIASAAAIILFNYPNHILSVLTKNHETVNTSIVIRCLITGSLFLACQYMPYHLALAFGHNKTNVIWGVCSLIITLPLTYFSIERYQLVGATIPWILLNFCAFTGLSFLIMKRLLASQFKKWLFISNLMPVATNIIIGIPFYFLLKDKSLVIIIIGIAVQLSITFMADYFLLVKNFKLRLSSFLS